MAKDLYVCGNCGFESIGWTGKCAGCGEFGTLVLVPGEELKSSKSSKKKSSRRVTSSMYSDIDLTADLRVESSFGEFDRVLGGGFVKGSVTLLSGNPGIGKSTIALQIAINLSENNYKTLYISAEESIIQVAKRAQRLNKNPKDLNILEGRDIESILAKIKKKSFDLIVWDSLQALTSITSGGIPGGVSQSRVVCNKIVDFTRNHNLISIIVGQVTKDGLTAGPMVVEHMVDCLLSLERIPDSTLRILRSNKNRFGSTMEVGVFDMSAKGFTDINAAENLFGNVDDSASGVVSSCILEGSRVLAVEIQSLVVPTVYGFPRRMARGIGKQRLEIIVAVLTKVLKLPLGKYDVFVNIAHGLSVKEPYIELAIAASIISSYKNLVVKRDLVFTGEVALSGSIRESSMIDLRKNSIERLKLGKIVSSNEVKNLSGLYGLITK